MCLNDAPQHRVAKNPVQCAQIHPLIFQELESRSCHGYKVRISATALTVNFPCARKSGLKGKEDRHTTFLKFEIGAQQVQVLPRQGLASSLEARLAWWRGDPPCEA